MGKWSACAFLFVVLSMSSPATAAAQNASSTTGQTLATMASSGYPLTVNSNVGESASVEAVLIPYNIVKHVFGAETGKNYIVIELIVTNHNPQASLIIQSVFLDYSRWSLRSGTGLYTGNQGNSNPDLCTNGVPLPSDAAPSQRLTCPAQIGSAEYRIVRAELLDRQPYTLRNLLVNGATAAGSIATAFIFPFSEDVVKGVAAWSGGFVPAVSAMFPDGTIGQLNHISDLGFQTNKVIPKQSSDIVVTFFPISRLLTQNLAKMFREDPAAFFVQGEMAIQHKYRKDILKFIQSVAPDFQANDFMRVFFASYCKPDGTLDYLKLPGSMRSRDTLPNSKLNPEDVCHIQSFLNSVTLTNVQVGLGGDMTVSTQVVPPTISEVDLKDSNGKTITPLSTDTFWAKIPSTATGTISGAYLTGGIPAVVDSQGAPIANIAIQAASQGATDSSLPFSMTISKCLSTTTGTEIYFKVTKPQTSANAAPSVSSSGIQNTTQVSSMLYDFGKVSYPKGCTNPPSQ
jgi:hypothetical protein